MDKEHRVRPWRSRRDDPSSTRVSVANPDPAHRACLFTILPHEEDLLVTENPYASPSAASETILDAELAPEELQPATQGRRFLNLIVDNIVTQILSMAAGLAFGVIYAASRLAANEPITADDDAALSIAGWVIGLSVSLLYFIVMESLFQRTIAKFLTGTRVIAANGSRPTFKQIVGRSFAHFIPFEQFSFLGGQHPVGWHDSLSGTRVVSTR